MDTKPKSCPFCGVNGLPHPLDHEEGCYLRYFYEILTMGSPVGGDVVREAWNIRAERTVKLKDNGHCPDCNRLVGTGERYCAYCGAKVVE